MGIGCSSADRADSSGNNINIMLFALTTGNGTQHLQAPYVFEIEIKSVVQTIVQGNKQLQ